MDKLFKNWGAWLGLSAVLSILSFFEKAVPVAKCIADKCAGAGAGWPAVLTAICALLAALLAFWLRSEGAVRKAKKSHKLLQGLTRDAETGYWVNLRSSGFSRQIWKTIAAHEAQDPAGAVRGHDDSGVRPRRDQRRAHASRALGRCGPFADQYARLLQRLGRDPGPRHSAAQRGPARGGYRFRAAGSRCCLGADLGIPGVSAARRELRTSAYPVPTPTPKASAANTQSGSFASTAVSDFGTPLGAYARWKSEKFGLKIGRSGVGSMSCCMGSSGAGFVIPGSVNFLRSPRLDGLVLGRTYISTMAAAETATFALDPGRVVSGDADSSQPTGRHVHLAVHQQPRGARSRAYGNAAYGGVLRSGAREPARDLPRRRRPASSFGPKRRHTASLLCVPRLRLRGILFRPDRCASGVAQWLIRRRLLISDLTRRRARSRFCLLWTRVPEPSFQRKRSQRALLTLPRSA